MPNGCGQRLPIPLNSTLVDSFNPLHRNCWTALRLYHFCLPGVRNDNCCHANKKTRGVLEPHVRNATAVTGQIVEATKTIEVIYR